MVNLSFDVEEINSFELDLEGSFALTRIIIESNLDKGKEITDETLSYIINPPPIYAAVPSDKMRDLQTRHAKKYVDEKESSLKITRLVKKEFYDFVCTESDTYKKERTSLSGNINGIIASIATALATTVESSLGISIGIGIITSFVATFMIIIAKIGKRAMCEAFKLGGG